MPPVREKTHPLKLGPTRRGINVRRQALNCLTVNVCLLGAKVETLPSIHVHAICPTECLWNKRMQKEPANTSEY